MNTARVRNAYRESESQAQIHPVKLIHLIYERVLTHLELAEEAASENEVKPRGENISKAIALVTELSASIKDDDSSEAAEFLRGLYATILVELPKVGLSNDVEIIRQAVRYIIKLKGIWEETAMVEAGLIDGDGRDKKAGAGVKHDPVSEPSQVPDAPSSYGVKKHGAGAVPSSLYGQGLSVSNIV